MHIATICLFIIIDLLLLLPERVAPLPGWLHLTAIVLLAQAIVVLWVLLRRREERMSSGLRSEISGMQQVLEQSARRYQSLLEGAGNAILVLNAQSHRLEEANRMAAELFGYSHQELAGLPVGDLLPAEEREKFQALFSRLESGEPAADGDLSFRRKDGSLFLGEIDARLIELAEESVVHCIVRDITAKVRTEREIWQRNRELTILNNVLTGVNQGPRLEGVLESTLAEALELFQAGGGTLHLLQDDASPLLAASQSVVEPLEQLIRSGLATPQGRPAELCLVNEDVAGSELYPVAAAAGWRTLTVVPLTGRGILVGVMHLMHATPRRYEVEELRFLESLGTQLGNVIEHARLFGELTWKSEELLRSHHLLEKSSHSLGLSEIKLKQNLALVEQANLELNRLDRMKNQFLGMVSHEFNTPLTSIIAGAELLLQDGCGQQNDQILQMVHDGGLRLKELVADLLKLVRLEAGVGQLSPSALHLELALKNLREQLEPQLAARGQTLRFTDLHLLPFFEGDWKYLERVFMELLLNAIRFSPEGGEIEVTGQVVDSDALRARSATLERFNRTFLSRCGDRCFLEVAVHDKGIGIPFEEQQGIFELFYEVGEIKHHSSGRSRHEGKGAGLGLAIVKGMVEAHGGMVWVESGQGSSFYLVLPLEQELIQPALF